MSAAPGPGGPPNIVTRPARTRWRRLLVLPLVAALLAGCGAVSSPAAPPSSDPGGAGSPAATLPAGQVTETLDVGGLERSLHVRTPERAADEELPVIIALHGIGGSGESFESIAGLTAHVGEDRFIAVYPDGAPLSDGATRAWNAGTCCLERGATPADDVPFIAGILDELPAHGGDPDRVYLAGFSNGGMLAYRSACELGDRIAGIAVVGGALNVNECASTTPMTVVIAHGTDDAVVPYAGGVSPLGGQVREFTNPSAQASVDAWVGRNGCAAAEPPATAGAVVERRYTDCAAGSSVAFFTVEGGRHTWFKPADGFDAADVILDAFVR